MLRVNWQKAGAEAQKFDRGEFILEDAIKKRVISLSEDWESCFQPGQRVNMSALFRMDNLRSSVCPHCQTENEGLSDQEIEW